MPHPADYKELSDFNRANALCYAVAHPVQGDPLQRRLFLYKVSRQLMSDYGGKVFGTEARDAYGSLRHEEKFAFLFNLADALHENGMEGTAQVLLRDHESQLGWQRWHATLSELEKIDPAWRTHARAYADQDGIQVDFGGFRQSTSHSVSVILWRSSYGNAGGLYEIRPVFAGKGLCEWDDTQHDDVMGWLPLEKAVRIAHAALAQDEAKYRREIATAYDEAA